MIRFWDLGCGDRALKEAFPNVYTIACSKDGLCGGPYGESYLVLLTSGMSVLPE